MGTFNDIINYLKSVPGKVSQAVTTRPELLNEYPMPDASQGTLLDVLYDVTGKQGFKTAADLLRPTEVDIGSMSAPLAAGKLGAAGLKTAGDLLQDSYSKYLLAKLQRPVDTNKLTDVLVGLYSEFDKLLQDKYPMVVDVPLYGYLEDFPGYTKNSILKFLETLDEMPENALEGLSELVLREHPYSLAPDVAGRYTPVINRLHIYPAAMRGGFSNLDTADVPHVLAHELAHHVFSRAGDDLATRKKIYDYLQDIGWPNIPEPHQYSINEFGYLDYDRGWRALPAPSSSWENLIGPWDEYFLHHPIEDMAESGGFALLETSPKFAELYRPQIQALNANQRVAIKDLLQFLNAL
jgi:hypothetical protein